MLVEFFLDHAKFEFSSDRLNYTGYVPDLPQVHVEGATLEECRYKLARAITDLLAQEAARHALVSNTSPQRPGQAPEPTTEPKAITEEKNSGESWIDPSRTRWRGGSAFAFDEIIYEKHEWVARVTINRPELYNVYSSTTLRQMIQAFRDAARDDKVAVLVLTGAGDLAFCTGSDLKEHSEEHVGHPQKYWEWMGLLIEAHDALRQLGKPSIARINGIVAGGGNEWNLACDLAVAADHAKFVQVETTVGMVAASGATQWLPLVIGDRRARGMLMTGEPVTADKALMWGLVNEVVPYNKLDLAVDTFCSKLVDKFPECIRYTRQQLNFWRDHAWEATIERARNWLAMHFAGPEAAEGMNALGERRNIDYRGIRALARQNGSNDTDFQREADPAWRFNRTAPGGRRSGSGLYPTDQSAKPESYASIESRPTRSCPWCGARGIPESFDYCGFCGARTH